MRMKLLVLAGLVLFGVLSVNAESYHIHGMKKGFSIRTFENPQSGLTEYYYERSWDGKYDLIPIIYNVPDHIKPHIKDHPFTAIHSCIISGDLWYRLIYVKHNTPKDGKTHGIYVIWMKSKTKCDGVKHIVSFTPDSPIVKTEYVTKYVTNTLNTVTGEITPVSDGKYDNIDFSFHK